LSEQFLLLARGQESASSFRVHPIWCGDSPRWIEWRAPKNWWKTRSKKEKSRYSPQRRLWRLVYNFLQELLSLTITTIRTWIRLLPDCSSWIQTDGRTRSQTKLRQGRRLDTHRPKTEDEREYLLESYVTPKLNASGQGLRWNGYYAHMYWQPSRPDFAHSEQGVFDFFDRTFYAYQYDPKANKVLYSAV
jgi:hypothetical protein